MLAVMSLAHSLLKKGTELGKCRFLFQEIFDENRNELEEILREENIIPVEKKPVGLLDGYEADFVLNPLPGEKSCREVLYPFTKKRTQKRRYNKIQATWMSNNTLCKDIE